MLITHVCVAAKASPDVAVEVDSEFASVLGADFDVNTIHDGHDAGHDAIRIAVLYARLLQNQTENTSLRNYANVLDNEKLSFDEEWEKVHQTENVVGTKRTREG